MSSTFAVEGKKSDVIKFINDGLNRSGKHIDDITEDILSIIEKAKLTTYNWQSVPFLEDTPRHIRVASLLIYNTALYDFDAPINKEDDCIITFKINTSPMVWLQVLSEKYKRLKFYMYE